MQHYISDINFRVYTSDDVIGAELCGALKNVIAIASGASDGFGMPTSPNCRLSLFLVFTTGEWGGAEGFGFDSRAALITRGLAEMTRLVVRKGGKAATMQGASYSLPHSRLLYTSWRVCVLLRRKGWRGWAIWC